MLEGPSENMRFTPLFILHRRQMIPQLTFPEVGAWFHPFTLVFAFPFRVYFLSTVLSHHHTPFSFLCLPFLLGPWSMQFTVLGRNAPVTSKFFFYHMLPLIRIWSCSANLFTDILYIWIIEIIKFMFVNFRKSKKRMVWEVTINERYNFFLLYPSGPIYTFTGLWTCFEDYWSRPWGFTV